MKFLIAFILLFAIACNGEIIDNKSENEKFIQGKWSLSGTIGDETENRAWYLEWEFNNGEFTQTGYPPITQKGKYKIIEDKENTLKLKLYKQKGTFGEEDSELIIIIDKENKSISINNKKGFKKISKENKE